MRTDPSRIRTTTPQVLILLGFEFVQSVNWLAGSIISEKLYGEVRTLHARMRTHYPNWSTQRSILPFSMYIVHPQSAYARRTRQELSAREKKGLTQACQVIGGLTYGVDIFLYLWNACLVRFPSTPIPL